MKQSHRRRATDLRLYPFARESTKALNALYGFRTCQHDAVHPREQQAVLLNQVDQLEFRVQMLDEKIDKMMDSDEEIMDQHKKLFEKLESGNTGYSYN